MDSLPGQNFINDIAKIKDLPTISPSYTSLINIINKTEINIDDLHQAIEEDQVLVFKMLKIINSGYYSLRNKIVSVKQAVGLLGLQATKQIIYSLWVMDSFLIRDEHLWVHSYSSFRLAIDIIDSVSLPNISPLLPVTALLHDIGQIVLQVMYPKIYLDVINTYCHAQINSESLYLFNIENNELGIDHAFAGSELVKKWGMDEAISTPILFHHSDEFPEKYISETVFLRLIDWIDCQTREIPSLELNPKDVEHAAMHNFNIDYWLNHHAGLIIHIDETNPVNILD